MRNSLNFFSLSLGIYADVMTGEDNWNWDWTWETDENYIVFTADRRNMDSLRAAGIYVAGKLNSGRRELS